MVNVELSENRTLQSRMGFTKVISLTDPVVQTICGLYKADWNNWTSTLYSARAWGLAKNNETTGAETFHSVLPNPTQRTVQFQRWKDKLLMLAQGESLAWMDSAESLNPVSYPQFKVMDNWATVMSIDTGGSLSASSRYQYTVSFVLGDNYRDGETSGALPSNDTKWPWPTPPPYGWKPKPGDYASISTTTTSKKVVGTALNYSGKLNGFDITAIKLFRRTAIYAGDPLDIDPGWSAWAADTPWVLMDTVYIEKKSDPDLGYIYALTGGTNNVLTAVNGIYNETDDTASVNIYFTDDGSVDYDAGQQPMPDGYLNNPKSKFMTRLNNRIFLGNIVGNDARDKKTVRFTYTGYLDPAATLEEIPNFHYQFPMLIFGPYSWFYCDQEDTDDEITGMYGYRNSLIIFTGKCTFMWQEGMKDPVKISNDVGCIAPDTIREFEGRLIWLSTNGIIMYDGSKLKNLSAAKANSYMLSLSKSYAYKACAAIFARRYYIAGPFGGTIHNDTVLVYDFDLNEWITRTYKILDATTNFYIDCFYKYSNGAKETLYTGGHSDAATPLCYIVKLDEGYDDGGVTISCSLKTKYFDFGAPDIIKNIRAFNIDMSNRNASTLTMDLYLDNLNEAGYTFSYAGAIDGFLLNDTARGRLNVDSIANISDEMFAFSLPIGKHSSRYQFGVEFTAASCQVSIHAMSIDWRVVRKLQRKYGGS